MASVTCDDGRSFAFDPETTAMLVIDFQRDFVEAEGGCAIDPGETERLAAIMPTVRESVLAARAADIEIIHTRESYSSDEIDVTGLKDDMGYVGREGPLGRCLIRGEPGCDFAPGMEPEDGELVVDKPGFSAFYETGLQDHLQSRGIRSLIITGITFNCCVHSTTRDAIERGYRCLTLKDCCAAGSADLEAAVLSIIRSEGNLFGWIADSNAFRVSLG